MFSFLFVSCLACQDPEGSLLSWSSLASPQGQACVCRWTLGVTDGPGQHSDGGSLSARYYANELAQITCSILALSLSGWVT